MPSTSATGRAGGGIGDTWGGESPPAGGVWPLVAACQVYAKARRLELLAMATGRPALNWERFAAQELEVSSRAGVFVAGRVTGGLIGLKGQVSLAAGAATSGTSASDGGLFTLCGL
jgi:hypothetical protein